MSTVILELVFERDSPLEIEANRSGTLDKVPSWLHGFSVLLYQKDLCVNTSYLGSFDNKYKCQDYSSQLDGRLTLKDGRVPRDAKTRSYTLRAREDHVESMPGSPKALQRQGSQMSSRHNSPTWKDTGRLLGSVISFSRDG